MNTDRDLQQREARRVRGRRLAWIAAGVSVAATLMALGPAPTVPLPRVGSRLLEQSAPAVPQYTVSLSAGVDWDAIEPSPDPSPLAVAAYER